MDTSQLKNLASQALQNAFGSVPDPSRRFGQSIPTPEYLPGTAGMFVQPYELEEVTPEGERIDYSVMLENLKRSIPVDIASTPGYVADIYNLPSSVGEYLNLRFRGRPEEAAAVEFFPRGSQSSELAEQAVTEFYGSPAPEFPNIQTEVATRGAQIFADPFAAVGGVKYLGALGRAARDVFTPTSPEELAAMQRLGIMAGEKSATADLQKLEEAKALMKEGEEPKNIWEKTGWALGEDNKWRYEIDDSASALRGGQESFENLLMNRTQQLLREGIKGVDEPIYLEDVFYHPKLYEAYPQLRTVEVEMLPADSTAKGARVGNTIAIRGDIGNGEIREIKLHEIQHVVQGIEGFTPGGSWKQFYRDPQELVAEYQTRIDELEDLIPDQYGQPGWMALVKERDDLINRQNAARRMTPEMAKRKAEEEYWRMFGEAEARQVPARADLSAEQRRGKYIYDPETFYWDTGVGLDETTVTAPRAAKGAEEMAEISRPANIPEGQALQFLHNTSAEKLLRQERMGGMPMPSVGVTREDVPFEGFGDITLVGRKEAFDPRTTRTNEIFSADAYTVRAPRPIRLANKDAYSRLKQEFGDVADRLGDSIMSEQYELEALSRKGSSTESAYDNVVRFFEYDYVPRIKFLEEKGIEIPLNKDGKIDRWAADDIVNQDFREEFFEWANNKKDEYLTGQELFITNPDRDYVLQKPRFAEYTADNVTKYMKKRSGRGQEGGMGSTGVGAQRAATTEQLSSMKAMQERRGEFVPRDEVERLREQQEQSFFDLTDELRKFYKYDANSFSYLDEVSEMITLSERKGLSSALKEVGFKDVSPEVVEKINQYKDSLRSSPVQYFEAKPKRTVQLEEFAGAIVPENTPQSVIDMLEAKGIKIEKYKDEAERLKLRSKFPNTMFSAAPIGVGVGAQYQGMESEAQPVRPEQFIKIPGQI